MVYNHLAGLISLYLESYRSGHNGAVLKTVRAQVHAGSNPALSAKKKKRYLLLGGISFLNDMEKSR